MKNRKEGGRTWGSQVLYTTIYVYSRTRKDYCSMYYTKRGKREKAKGKIYSSKKTMIKRT
jgi:hypothetical protein